MNSENCSNPTIKNLLSEWEKQGLFQSNKEDTCRQPTRPRIADDQQEGNNQQQNFTLHHQIPPKKVIVWSLGLAGVLLVAIWLIMKYRKKTKPR